MWQDVKLPFRSHVALNSWHSIYIYIYISPASPNIRLIRPYNIIKLIPKIALYYCSIGCHFLSERSGFQVPVHVHAWCAAENPPPSPTFAWHPAAVARVVQQQAVARLRVRREPSNALPEPSNVLHPSVSVVGLEKELSALSALSVGALLAVEIPKLNE